MTLNDITRVLNDIARSVLIVDLGLLSTINTLRFVEQWRPFFDIASLPLGVVVCTLKLLLLRIETISLG